MKANSVWMTQHIVTLSAFLYKNDLASNFFQNISGKGGEFLVQWNAALRKPLRTPLRFVEIEKRAKFREFLMFVVIIVGDSSFSRKGSVEGTPKT
jgi:hypothetical protein